MPVSRELAYAVAHVPNVVPSSEVAKAGGIARWIIDTLKNEGLLGSRFLTSTDVHTRKLTATFDENALAGNLSTLTTLGVGESLDIPQLGDKRLTVVLKGKSRTGPRYVGSSGGLRHTTGTSSEVETGKLTERVTAGGIGPNVRVRRRDE